MLNTVTTGDIGEAIAIAKFTQKECIVSKPLNANARYDLIIEYNNRLYKVQVKTTNIIKDNEKMIFATKTTNYTKGNWKSNGYSSNEIDFFFLYCLENDWCGLYFGEPDGSFITELTIRTIPSKKANPKARPMQDYDFNKQFEKLILN